MATNKSKSGNGKKRTISFAPPASTKKSKKGTLKSQVERILKSYVRCRSNDLLLYAKVLNRYYGADIIDDNLRLDLNIVTSGAYPSMESVARIRRKFQAKGWFTPSTREKRFKKQKNKQPGAMSPAATKRLKVAASKPVKTK